MVAPVDDIVKVSPNERDVPSLSDRKNAWNGLVESDLEVSVVEPS